MPIISLERRSGPFWRAEARSGKGELLPIMLDNALAAERHEDALLLQRLAHPLSDYGRIVVDGERHGALESMRTRDKHPEPAIERVGSDPGFVRASRVPAASNHGGFDALTAVTWDAFDVENRERHTS